MTSFWTTPWEFHEGIIHPSGVGNKPNGADTGRAGVCEEDESDRPPGGGSRCEGAGHQKISIRVSCLASASQKQIGHGFSPGKVTTVRRPVTDLALTSIRPVPRKPQRELDAAAGSPLQAGTWPTADGAVDHIPARSEASGVLDQNPGHRPTVVRGHHVVQSNGRSSGRETDHLPDPALRAALTCVSPRTEWLSRHLSPSSPDGRKHWWDASRLIARKASAILTVDIEPRGSLFAVAASQWLTARPPRVAPLGGFLFILDNYNSSRPTVPLQTSPLEREGYVKGLRARVRIFGPVIQETRECPPRPF
jgi:hypothetical protein